MIPGPAPQTMADLQAMMLPGGALSCYPAAPIPSSLPHFAASPSLTAQDVQAMIDASISRSITVVHSPLEQFDSIFQQALSPDDFAAFTTYVQDGAKGFSDLMKSDALHPIAQLLWETIKEHAE
jgi:hypothetical protein